jgi:NifU-like protein
MWNYTKKVLDHFLHPRNVGEIKNPDGFGEVGSMACGDALRLTFKVDKKKKIKDVKFRTFGCASAIASSSALTEIVKGKTVNQAEKITNKDIANYLGGLPEAKMHCSVMGREALQEAIKNYRGEKRDKKLIQGKIVCECFGVTEKEIKDAIKENDLTSVEQVTFHTKAGGACENCHPRIEELIKEVEKETTTKKEKIPKKLTNLEKIGLIQKVINEAIRPALQKDGGDIEIVDVDGDIVYLKLVGACATCVAAHHTMKQFVEQKLRNKVSPKLRVQEVK